MRTLCAAAVLAAIGGRIEAQERVHPEARIRLHVAEVVTRAPRDLPTRVVVGTLHTIAPDTVYLELASNAQRSAIPRMFIQRVDYSLGPRSRRESAKELAALGALLGLMIPPVIPRRTAAFLRKQDQGVIVGMALGAAGGALVGFLVPYERWRTGWIP